MARTKGSKNRLVRPPTERITGDVSPEVAQKFKAACAARRLSHGQALEPILLDWLRTEREFGPQKGGG